MKVIPEFFLILRGGGNLNPGLPAFFEQALHSIHAETGAQFDKSNLRGDYTMTVAASISDNHRPENLIARLERSSFIKVTHRDSGYRGSCDTFRRIRNFGHCFCYACTYSGMASFARTSRIHNLDRIYWTACWGLVFRLVGRAVGAAQLSA